MERLRIDDGGRLQPQDAKTALPLWPGREGEWAVLPSGMDLLMGIRLQPRGGAAGKPRALLLGDCSAFPFTDLLAYLAQARWTGVVRVHGMFGERALGIKHGDVRWAQSDAMTDRLGEVMMRLGVLNPQQLDRALRNCPPSKIGRYLVDKGHIQAHDLWKCLNEQIGAIFHVMLSSKEGAFSLWDQDVDERSSQNFSVGMQGLLMDSIRKIDEMELFRKKIPNAQVKVTARRASDGRLEPEEDQVLATLKGMASVAQLSLSARLSEFDTTRAVYRLLEGGFLELVDDTAPLPAPSPPVAPVVVPMGEGLTAPLLVRVYNQVFHEIRAELARHMRVDAYLRSANSALTGQGLSPQPVLVGLEFRDDGTLNEAEVLKRYEVLAPTLGSAPLMTLRHALMDLMFFLLFQSGELLGPRADEGLSSRVKSLLSTLDAPTP